MNIKNQLSSFGMALVMAVVMLSGCYPDGPEYYSDTDVVITHYDDAFDFGTVKTYAIPDSIPKISDELFSDPDGDGKPDFVNSLYANTILSTMRAQLNALGWTEVDKTANPDVTVFLTATTSENLYAYYNMYYWDWYYPGYWGGWGWYYPGYYPVEYVSVNTGTLFMQMADMRNSGVDDKLNAVWTGVINGLLSGSATDINKRINNTVEQAFTQSPYLKP